MKNEKRSKIYDSWYDMKQRCLNPNYPSYHRYGGRGIQVCLRWLEFQNFYDDMHESWFPGATIDRINNDGNYEPANCRWLSKSKHAKKSMDERSANGTHSSRRPEARKKMSERMKQKHQDPEWRKNHSAKMKGTIVVWDLVEQKCVSILTDLYRSNRERYLHRNSKEYKNLKR